MVAQIVRCCVCGEGVDLPEGFRVGWKYRCPDCYRAGKIAAGVPQAVTRRYAPTTAAPDLAAEIRANTAAIEELRRAIDAMRTM